MARKTKTLLYTINKNNPYNTHQNVQGKTYTKIPSLVPTNSHTTYNQQKDQRGFREEDF